jgi:hypothetical protein
VCSVYSFKWMGNLCKVSMNLNPIIRQAQISFFLGTLHPLSHFPMQCMSGRKQHGREEIIRIRVYLSSASVQKECVTPSLC